MIDQLLLYDQAVLTWLADNFPGKVPGRTTQILVATPRKSFAEATTGLVVDNRTMTLPRISLQRLDPENDPTRFNSNRIRFLGWCNSPSKNKLVSGNFPVPIFIPYQIDLHTRFVKEMNLWERFVLESFSPQYMYLNVRPNDIWGNKQYAVFQEGSVINNSDLEPDEGERQIRKTFTIRCECWLFPDDFISQNVVKRLEAVWLDADTSAEYDRSFMPPAETLDTGDGSIVVFSGTLSRWPALEHTVVIQTVIGGITEIVTDQGSGTLLGDKVSSGTIDYATGAYVITFSDPPDLDESITATYFTDQTSL